MNWTDARIALADGHKVRRPLWYTCLKQVKGVITWDITEELARKCNDGGSADRTYRLIEIEADANDWVRA